MVTDSATVTMESLEPPSLFRMVPLLNADPLRPHLPPKWGFHMPQDTRMAISPQRVIRHTSCLVLGNGFMGRRIEWRYFRLHQIQVGGRPPSWIILNGHISAMAHSIHLNSAHRVVCAVIFAIAYLSVCYLVRYRQLSTTQMR